MGSLLDSQKPIFIRPKRERKGKNILIEPGRGPVVSQRSTQGGVGHRSLLDGHAVAGSGGDGEVGAGGGCLAHLPSALISSGDERALRLCVWSGGERQGAQRQDRALGHGARVETCGHGMSSCVRDCSVLHTCLRVCTALRRRESVDLRWICENLFLSGWLASTAVPGARYTPYPRALPRT